MDSAPRKLDYAPASPFAHQAIFLRVFRWTMVLLLLAAGIYWGPQWWEHGRYLYWQRNSLQFSLATDQVVYSNRSGDFANLVGPRYCPVAAVTGPRRTNATVSTGVPVGYVFNPLAKLGEGTIGAYSAVSYQRASIGKQVNRTGAFLHLRRSTQGARRLVCVLFIQRTDFVTGEQFLELNGLTWQLADWSLDSRLQLRGLTTMVLTSMKGRNIRVFAGQADPLHEAKFTIAYEVDGTPGVIDGWLDEMESVRFHVRTGPAAGAEDEIPAYR